MGIFVLSGTFHPYNVWQGTWYEEDEAGGRTRPAPFKYTRCFDDAYIHPASFMGYQPPEGVDASQLNPAAVEDTFVVSLPDASAASSSSSDAPPPDSDGGGGGSSAPASPTPPRQLIVPILSQWRGTVSIFGPGGKLRSMNDHFMLSLAVDPENANMLTASGHGSAQFGQYTLSGTWDLATQQLTCTKIYTGKAKTKSPARPKAKSVPKKPSVNADNIISAGGAGVDAAADAAAADAAAGRRVSGRVRVKSKLLEDTEDDFEQYAVPDDGTVGSAADRDDRGSVAGGDHHDVDGSASSVAGFSTARSGAAGGDGAGGGEIGENGELIPPPKIKKRRSGAGGTEGKKGGRKSKGADGAAEGGGDGDGTDAKQADAEGSGAAGEGDGKPATEKKVRKHKKKADASSSAAPGENGDGGAAGGDAGGEEDAEGSASAGAGKEKKKSKAELKREQRALQAAAAQLQAAAAAGFAPMMLMPGQPGFDPQLMGQLSMQQQMQQFQQFGLQPQQQQQQQQQFPFGYDPQQQHADGGGGTASGYPGYPPSSAAAAAGGGAGAGGAVGGRGGKRKGVRGSTSGPAGAGADAFPQHNQPQQQPDFEREPPRVPLHGRDRSAAAGSQVFVAARVLGPESGVHAGCIFEGEMSGNQPHGWGTMVYKNGLCYEGSWSHGKEHGWGTISDPDDWTLYEGEMSEGGFNGAGCYYYGNGDRYAGGWKDGLPHGKGVYTSIVGSSYDGEWLDGNRHGIGIMTFKDGSTYNGHWMHGQKHGRGELTMVTGFRYRGGWDRDSMQGKCEMSYPDGSKYEGACLNGKREGRGTYLFTDGQHLSGKWCNDNIDPALTSGSLHMPKAVWTVVSAADIDTAAASNSNVGTSEAADAGAAPGSQSRGEEASLQHNQPQQSQRRMSVQGGRSTGGGFECMIPIHLENDTFNKIHLRAGFDKTGQ